MQIKELVSLADHYYLSETEGVHNSIGWGPKGIELRGIISITTEQHQRIKQFTEAVKYNIALNNCEHFANYVMYGLNLSSQQQNWWKSLGSDIIQRLQPSNSINQNIEQEIANLLNYNLAVVKISKFQKEYLDFYKTYQQKNT
ncbi:MAG: NC domain-containing protein [Snowella sp.]|nr:MAG: NC domain-containing protein [Snowella sp.]